MSHIASTRLCRLPEVCQKTGLARSTIYALAQRGEFPKPIKITSQASGWPLEVVDGWIADRISATTAAATESQRGH
jgi:prophage regulatory protein